MESKTSLRGGSNIPTTPTKHMLTSYWWNLVESTRSMSSGFGGLSMVAANFQFINGEFKSNLANTGQWFATSAIAVSSESYLTQSQATKGIAASSVQFGDFQNPAHDRLGHGNLLRSKTKNRQNFRGNLLIIFNRLCQWFLSYPTRTCVQRSNTPSGAPLINILGPFPIRVDFNGVQKEDIDFLSLENSKVNSCAEIIKEIVLIMHYLQSSPIQNNITFFHFVSISCRTAIAAPRRSNPVFPTLNGFIFSARTMRAVSVASPTFSNTCLNYMNKVSNVICKYIVTQL